MPLNFLNTGYFSENVGIGVTSPAASLDIRANFALNGSYTSSGWAKYIILDAENTGGGGIIWTKQSSTYNRAILNNQGKFEIGRSTANDNSADWITDLAITPTGNVGIGTSGFAQKRLDISGPTGGQVLITGASDNVGTTAGIMFRSEASEENGLARVKGGIFFERIAGTYGNGKLKFAVNSSANNDTVAVSDVAITIDTNKNVGIGTDEPSFQLSIENHDTTTSTATLEIDGKRTNETDGPVGELIFSNNGDTFATVAGVRDGADNKGSFQFQTQDGAFATRMTISSEGNVGIGTTTPNNLLSLQKNVADGDVAIYVQNNNSVSASIDETASLKFAHGNDNVVGYEAAKIVAGKEGDFETSTSNIKGFLSFYTASGTSLDSDINNKERIRVLGNGDVGIGTIAVTSPGFWYDAVNDYLAISHWATPPTPAALLHLSDNSDNVDVPQIRIEGRENPGDTKLDISVRDPQVRFNLQENTADSVNGYGLMTFRTNAIPNAAINRGGFNFEVGATGGGFVQALTITNQSNIGIGTATPQSKLQVVGGIQMADDTATPSATKVGTMRYRTGTEYVETTGIELVTNGDFAADTNWTKGTGWTISGGKGNGASAGGDLTQTISIPINKTYRVKYTISNYSAGIFRVILGAYVAGTNRAANGTYTDIINVSNVSSNSLLYLAGDVSAVTLSIDDVSVMEITQEDASYVDMCMQTGASTYEWVNIVRNTY